MQQGQKRAQHDDLTKIQQMWCSCALPREGAYHHLTVEHEDWCDIVAGQRCHCAPDSTRTFRLGGQAKH